MANSKVSYHPAAGWMFGLGPGLAFALCPIAASQVP